MNWRFLIPSVLYMALIWVLSAQPGDVLSLPRFSDKPAHFVEFAILGYLLARTLEGTRFRWGVAWILAAAYGLLDEYHQSFVPGRYPSGMDFLMDTLGAAAGGRLGIWGRRGEK